MKNLILGFCLLMSSVLSAHPLMTVSGVSLGKTTAAELAQMPGVYIDLNNGSVNYQNLILWYAGEKKVFYTFMLYASNHFQNWPAEWQRQGLLPNMNYQQIKSFLESAGFRTISSDLVVESVHLKRLEGTFLAEDRRALTLKFDFNQQDQLVIVTAFGMPRPQ